MEASRFLDAPDTRSDLYRRRCRFTLIFRRYIYVSGEILIQRQARTGRGLGNVAGFRRPLLCSTEFSFLRTLTAWHCPHSPAALLCSVLQAIARHLPTAGPTAANLLLQSAAVGPCWDRQTERQTGGQVRASYNDDYDYYNYTRNQRVAMETPGIIAQ